MTTLTLYEVAHEHRAMVEALMSTQDDAAAIADTIEAESYPLEIKAQSVAYAIRNMEATAEAIKAAEAQMAERRKAIENRAKRIKEYLQSCMEIAGMSKIECAHFALTIKNNPASVEVLDEKQIPQDYMREVPASFVIDKTLIKRAISDGFEVPGAKLTQGKRLEIR